MPEWVRALVANPCFLPCGILLIVVVGGIVYFFATGGKIRFWINGGNGEG